MLFNDTNDISIVEVRYSIKEIITGIILKFLVIFFSLTGIVIQVFNAFKGGTDFQIFTYFTTISNIVIAFACLAMLFYEVVRLFTGDDYRSPLLYRFKFAATVGITITFLMYTALIMPMVIANYGIRGVFSSPDNLFIHFISPILAIVDFFICDYSYKSKRSDVYYPVIYLYAYFIVVLIMSLLGYRWKALGTIGGESVMPYGFINYKLNGWFTFDFSNANLGAGITGIGVVYMVLFVTIFVIILSLIYLRIKNYIQRKKYHYFLREESYHSDK